MGYVIGLSPFLEDHTKDPLFRELIGFVLEELPLESSLWICDAFHLRTIARIEVPNLGAFRSAKTRANQFREPIRKLKAFLAEKHPQPQAAGLTFDQALRFPQFLDFVGDTLGGSARDVVVMVLGSPLYLDEKEPGFSMASRLLPIRRAPEGESRSIRVWARDEGRRATGRDGTLWLVRRSVGERGAPAAHRPVLDTLSAGTGR